MKLKALTLENFRAYAEPKRVEFDDLTTIIGRNDIGKSTILEALEIFFNNGLVKLEQPDANVRTDDDKVAFTAEFDDLPESLIVDSDASTSLEQEYLLNKTGRLVIRKVFDCSKKNPTVESFVIADHPKAAGIDNLLEAKEKDLQKLVRDRKLDVSLKGNPGMRHAIWASASELDIGEVAIPVSKPKEDNKRIWEQIEQYLPIFALFQSDRPSKESDGEVQSPLKAAIASAISEVQDEIQIIQQKVQERAEEIARLTQESLKSIDATLAQSLTPRFTPPTPAKWNGLFTLGMETDENIPLDKRGSGVRRLILVSFFKAEAERKLASSSKSQIFYAVEEPETSQHPANQSILVEAFKNLAQSDGCQVILTTHSPNLAGELPVDSVRFVHGRPFTTPDIDVGADVFGQVAETLGLLPDSRVRVLICVEGPTDVVALQHLSRAMHEANSGYPDLFSDPRCAFIVTGGSTLKHWIAENYLRDLGRAEVHIYDNDVATYGNSVDQVNGRDDGRNSWATLTGKHEIECYLHPDAIRDAFGIDVNVVDMPDENSPAPPRAFGIAYSQDRGLDGTMGDNKSKQYLSKAFRHMTAARIQQRDPEKDIESWLGAIASRF